MLNNNFYETETLNVNITALTDGLVSRALREFKPDVVHLRDHYFLSRNVLRAARQHHVTRVTFFEYSHPISNSMSIHQTLMMWW